MTGQATNESERRQIQIATNQSIFREVNENLKSLNRDFIEVIPVGDFVCECGDTQCTQRIGLTVTEYEELRSDPTHFAVRHGHVFPEAERVVDQRIGYTVVEKIGSAGEFAMRADPRS